MWLWRPRRPRGKLLFFLEVMGVTALLHLIMMVVLCVCNGGHYEHFSFEMRKDDAQKKIPVLFLARLSKAGRQKTARQSAVAARARVTNKTAAAKKTVAKAPKKKVAPLVQAKKTQQTVAQTTVDAPATKQKKQKKEHKKEIKKEQPRQKQEEKKEETKPVVEQPKKEEPKSEPVPPIESSNEISEQSGAHEQEVMDCAFSLQEDGESGEEMPYEIARVYLALREGLSESWKPPMGLAKELVCAIAFRIERDGQVTAVAVKEPSGVLVYDVCARQAVQQLQLPSYTWGREYSITFRQ